MTNKLLVVLGAIALAASANMAIGSGSYTSRPPLPRGQKAAADRGKSSIDHAKYALGQRVYEGKVDLRASTDATAQRERLTLLQARLPEREKKDLVALAGKLTNEQLSALEYYVNQRFGR